MSGLPGVVLAVDVGTVRVGVAASDPHRILASPVETVPAPGHARVAELVAERDAVLVVVGLPTSLSGRSASASAEMARAWVAAFAPLSHPCRCSWSTNGSPPSRRPRRYGRPVAAPARPAP